MKTTLYDWFTTSGRQGKSGRPLVTLTYAQSLDGSITHRRDEPGLAISGPETKRMTHWLRTRHDAILVGVGTLLADNPKLTVTHAQGQAPRPVILDSRLQTPPTARVFAHPQPPLIACLESEASGDRARALLAAGADILPLPPNAAGHLHLPALLGSLYQRGIRSLMVEGGAGVITSFLREGLADVVILTIAPFFVGGVNALTAPLPAMPRLKNVGMQTFGEDVVVWGEL
ncbi:MAG: dihydrofolate reductase family protein [Anaerolineales bacterium]